MATFSPEKWTTIANSSIKEETSRGGKNYKELLEKVPFGSDFDAGYSK